MGFMRRLLGKSAATTVNAQIAALCPHSALVPKWDSVGDMGHEEKATSYACDACHESFTPSEARALRQTEAERLKQQLKGPAEL